MHVFRLEMLDATCAVAITLQLTPWRFIELIQAQDACNMPRCKPFLVEVGPAPAMPLPPFCCMQPCVPARL